MEVKKLEDGVTLKELFAGKTHIPDDEFYCYMVGIEYHMLNNRVTEEEFYFYKENFLRFILEERQRLIRLNRYDD